MLHLVSILTFSLAGLIGLGVIAMTVAVRETCIVGATSPKNSPARRMLRAPIDVCDTVATPETST